MYPSPQLLIGGRYSGQLQKSKVHPIPQCFMRGGLFLAISEVKSPSNSITFHFRKGGVFWPTSESISPSNSIAFHFRRVILGNFRNQKSIQFHNFSFQEGGVFWATSEIISPSNSTAFHFGWYSAHLKLKVPTSLTIFIEGAGFLSQNRIFLLI